MQKFKRFSGTNERLSPERLKEFRAYVAQLKHAGYIGGKALDARSARPYMRRGGKTLAEIVNENRKKLDTSKYIQKTAPKSAPKPPLKSEAKTKLAPLKSPISVRNFAPGKRSLAGTLDFIEKNEAAIDRMKREEETWAFQIDGMKSYHLYHNVEDMIRDLKKYKNVKFNARRHGQSADQFFDAIKLVRWNDTRKKWKPEKQHMNKAQKERASHSERQARHRAKKRASK